jgi:hypothetical protein
MGWNRVMPEVMRSFFADFRAWPKTHLLMNMITHQTKGMELHRRVRSPVLKSEDETIEKQFFHLWAI